MDGIRMIRLARPATCGCGERLGAGEQVGFEPALEATLCLRCVADRARGESATPVTVDVVPEGPRPQARREVVEAVRRLVADGAIVALHGVALASGDGPPMLLEHVVIGAAAVIVCTSPRVDGSRVMTRVPAGAERGTPATVYVDDVARPELLDAVQVHAELVRRLLTTAGLAAPVVAAVCFVDAQLPVFGPGMVAGSTLILGRRELRRVAALEGPQDAVVRARIADALLAAQHD